jgi:hypothetical protein
MRHIFVYLMNNMVRLVTLTLVTVVVVLAGAKVRELFNNARVAVNMTQIKGINAAIQTFKERYHYLPGDLPNAGKILPGCPGIHGSDCDPFPPSAGDGIIGDPEFSKTLKPQAFQLHTPATAAADETILFWRHLYFSGLLPGLQEDSVSLPSKAGGELIVGHANGSPFPSELTPKGPPLKGTILVQVSGSVLYGSSAMNEPGKQAISPHDAWRFDAAKFDDHRPDSGFIRAYGTHDCFIQKNNRTFFNESNDERDCGLIYDILEHDDDEKNDSGKVKKAPASSVIPKKRSD